ncbi:F-box only protein 43 [Toxotes jaculatrix]|uniref:F-box only protein 43 n=1 Tax=Toxotes jaculatrix TaxID=941984 RepID=UPI001B3AD573|nr:F-box only protein 43 [Toxotes jaculatrix]XP_040900693.1 F-box only protein 43 [Toxotes jaculatrix]XP_040900694.1 F-box only protein 43 [Toxotes jaculatrix]
MQCTPESNVYLESCKSQHCYDDCCDSGYSGLFHSPRSISGVDSCRSLSPVEFNETPKENLRLSVTPKVKTRESIGLLDKDSSRVQWPSAVNWCETPKIHKRHSLRHRLLMCNPSTDVKTDSTTSPCTRRTESSVSTRSEHWLSVSFDSLETVTGALASSTLKLDQDLPLSGRKRRLLFSQVRTSTLEDGKLHSGHPPNFERRVSFSGVDFSRSISASDEISIETPHIGKFLPASSKENSQSPVSSGTNGLNDTLSGLCTPSSTPTPKYIRFVCEDSGFSSLALDKSQDSSVDHDGSFQELLLSASRRNCETPSLAEAKRRSRLQRQYRLSTLKEGGSQSEEDPADRKHEHPHQCHSYSKDDVFADGTTPPSVLPVRCGNSMTSDGLANAKQDYATPLRAATIAKPENMTPFGTAHANPDLTPHRTTPVNLSLTPALQLVHAMCQQKAQMFVGQSPSLKEQLKSTAALAETPLTFRTAMPLAGLIGRKMGLGKVDILTELKKRNLRHILAVILSQLTSESVYRCGQVCKSWNEIIQQDKQANIRRRSHLSEVKATLELSGAVHVPEAETRLTLLKRSALKTVQAQSRTSSYCTPQSGNSTLIELQHSVLHSGSSSKREKFLEVAKTLFNDESLKPCPRCQHPARCHSVKGEGVCSRADCAFQFCTACLCAFHGSRECGSQSVGRRKSDILLPGSAQSRRNVRRL